MKTCVLVLDNIRSVENAGSIFRTADCLGVSRVYLVGTTPAPLDRFGRPRADFAKVSLGAEKSVDWEYKKDLGETLEELRDNGFSIVVLEQNEKAKKLESFKADGLSQVALIVGNEVEGVSAAGLERSDVILEIGMKGRKESLNVSVAAGIALFTLLNS